MATTTYAIDSADGNNLTTGIQGYAAARRIAQELADERAETVSLYPTPIATDEDGEGLDSEIEEIAPSGASEEG